MLNCPFKHKELHTHRLMRQDLPTPPMPMDMTLTRMIFCRLLTAALAARMGCLLLGKTDKVLLSCAHHQPHGAERSCITHF